MVLNSLGGAYQRQGKFAQALAAFEKSRELEEKLGNERGLAMVLNSLGNFYQRQHDYNQAIAVLQKSYDLEIALNDVRGQAMVLTSLGQVYQQKGDLDAAVSAFERSIAIEQMLGNRRGQAMVLCAWGKALLNFREPQQAAEKLAASFEIDEPLRNTKGLRVVTPSLVRALTLIGRKKEARDYVARALALVPTDKRLLTLQQQLAESHPVSSQTTIKTGTIKRLFRKPTGYLYGFIATDDSKDIYFGEENVAQALLASLTEGVAVTAEVELSARGPRARQVWQENHQLETPE
jgi:tetratricopeptide (TPR) repeat protein